MQRRFAPISTILVLLVLLSPLTLLVGAGRALAQDAATDPTAHPVSIDAGSCAAPSGTASFTAGNTGVWGVPESPASAAVTDPILVAEQTIATTIESLQVAGQPYAVVVHSSPEDLATVVACGDIVGDVVGGKLAVSVRPVGGSGLAGVALLNKDEQGFLGLGQAEVQLTVYLSGGLGASATPASPAPTPTPTPPPANAVQVTIQNFAFAPPTLAITTGTTVTWTNKDQIAHTATADDQSFDSGNLNTGQTWSFTFNQPGTFAYTCTYHPYMKGTITVTGDPIAASPPPTAAAAAPQTPAATAPTTVPAAVATPVSSTGISVVATGLHAPRGMTWGGDGALYVVQSGTGDTATSIGPAANVVRIDNGCPVPVATGLPSTQDPYKDVMGPQDIATLGGKLYVVEGSTGPLAEMPPATPNGVFEVQPDGTLRLVADLTTWILANPTIETPGDANTRGEPYKILPGDGFLWVLESNRGEVLKVTLDGQISRVADLSVGHEVFAGFALAADGGVYVGTLTPAPHTDGAAKVIKVTAAGQVSDVWVNLTVVTGVIVAADGTLYAIEMATNNGPEGQMAPGTGRLVRQTGADQSAAVAINLDYPIGLALGPDGMAYVASPAYGDNDQAGMILRIDLTAPQPMALDAAQMAPAPCPAAATPVADPASPVPFPIESPAAG